MRRTNIYLDDQQVELLDLLARQEGVPRAQVVRRLVDQGLQEAGTTRERDLAAITSSFGVLGDVEPGDRGPDARAAHLARMWQAQG